VILKQWSVSVRAQKVYHGQVNGISGLIEEVGNLLGKLFLMQDVFGFRKNLCMPSTDPRKQTIDIKPGCWGRHHAVVGRGYFVLKPLL
jgi:hypothetical protein